MANILSVKFKYLYQLGVITFPTDSFKIILMNSGYTFSEDTDDTYADVIASELPTANGYTAGGILLTNPIVLEDTFEDISSVTFNPVSWAVSSGQLITRGAIIFDDTVSSPIVDPVVGFIDFGGVNTVNTYGSIVINNIKLTQR